MRKSATVFFSFMLINAGCISPIKYTYQEHCALDGLKLSHVASSATSGYASSGSGSAVYEGSSEVIGCTVPASQSDQQEINRLMLVAEPKREWNSKWFERNLITVLGYAAWIFPGIGASIYYWGEKDDAIQASREVAAKNPAPQITEVRQPSSEGR